MDVLMAAATYLLAAFVVVGIAVSIGVAVRWFVR